MTARIRRSAPRLPSGAGRRPARRRGGRARLHDLAARPAGRPCLSGRRIARAEPAREGVDQAIRRATALGGQRVSRIDLEFAVRQLVKIAVRALSPGINDPHTTMSVLDRLGAALCGLVPRHLPPGTVERGDRVVLAMPVVDHLKGRHHRFVAMQTIDPISMAERRAA